MYLLFFFNGTATTEIYTLSLHDALPIYMIGLATVGKARTLLAMGRIVDADTVASATSVPTTFFYVVQHDNNTARQQNGVFRDRKSTRLNSSPPKSSYARFCLTKKPTPVS